MKLTLDADDLSELLHGRVLSVMNSTGPNFEIILADIGFDAIQRIVDMAILSRPNENDAAEKGATEPYA